MISFLISSNELRFVDAVDHLGRTKSAKKIERFVNKVASMFNLTNIEWSGNNDDGVLWATFEPEITEEQGAKIEDMWEEFRKAACVVGPLNRSE